MSDWDKGKIVCGNCKHWPLGGYQHNMEGMPPLGIGGPNCDGTVSDCRRHAPCAVSKSSPSNTALWPATKRDDSCGDFERRPLPRAPKPPRRFFKDVRMNWVS